MENKEEIRQEMIELLEKKVEVKEMEKVEEEKNTWKKKWGKIR